jgi:hypothetical protein
VYHFLSGKPLLRFFPILADSDMGDVVVSVVVGGPLFDTDNPLSHNLLLPRCHVR